MFLELLHNKGVLYCVSLAKFGRKDYEKEVLAHIANGEAFPKRDHVFDQLHVLVESAFRIGDWSLQSRFFECHTLVATYALVTKGEATAIGHILVLGA